ncbi:MULTISPECIES: SpoIIE family protein phosphatase [unclassified Streptomyces]|uniref:SpoIIE family protein phosphatase n=1 Tax=unclassified Streptomyces TaxID=2593676 RepID=UPI0029B721BA|nr:MULTISPECIES: SpoIIE family protein phosphatase [unclassified Streptomyces]MDX2729833.1 SpoIIE family protein phosphatase [Streptomyces sp. PA03-2a]MDX3768484.1 SpoIIE family protein phosphatase [Streptomyces sp. AK08-01B]MDX3817815.1 SpoIIE family protein phosphatase [Streptomyces sp. AK08-01A]
MSDAGAPVPASTKDDGLDAALLDRLFDQSVVGLHVLDPQLRLVRISSPPGSDLAEQVLGRHFTDAYHLDRPNSSTAELLQRVLDTGVPVHDRLVHGRAEGAPGPSRSFLVTVYRLNGKQGQVLGLLAAVVDVTEREKARTRAIYRARLLRSVGRSLDMATTCQGLVEAVVPGFADFAVVEVVDEVLRGADPPLAPLGAEVPLRRAALRGLMDAEGRDGLVSDTRRLPAGTPFALAVSDLQPRHVALDADSPWLAADPQTARVMRALDAHSLMVVPLTLHGAVLGLVSLYRGPGSEPYDANDTTLAQTAAVHVALSIDNARRYERDHVIASTVQRRLLPQGDSARIAVDTAHVLLPGRNIGCWFDTIGLSGARTALVVGNVAGHGLQTAIAMGQLRTVIQALAGLDLEPAEVLARLNDTADRLAAERAALPAGDTLHRESLNASCVYAVYDPFSRTCTVARAGHPAPIVIAPDGSTPAVDVPEGPALFASDSAPFATAVLEIDEGSILAFATGALLPDDESAARVRRALARPDRDLQRLCDGVVYSQPTDSLPDGAALLLARTGRVPPERVATWELVHERTTPAVARTLVRDRLDGWNLDDETVQATELIVSELVTNAVRYGTPPLQLRLILDRSLTCEVHDSSPVAPHLRHARTVDEGGRGLFIVSQLATHWGTRYDRHGKALWTEQEVPGLR